MNAKVFTGKTNALVKYFSLSISDEYTRDFKCPHSKYTKK
jgi:hypothetical protein